MVAAKITLSEKFFVRRFAAASPCRGPSLKRWTFVIADAIFASDSALLRVDLRAEPDLAKLEIL